MGIRYCVSCGLRSVEENKSRCSYCIEVEFRYYYSFIKEKEANIIAPCVLCNQNIDLYNLKNYLIHDVNQYIHTICYNKAKMIVGKPHQSDKKEQTKNKNKRRLWLNDLN